MLTEDTQVAYRLTESTNPSDGQSFVNTFAGKGEKGTFIIGPNVFKGADQILSAWTNVPKAVKGLEHVSIALYSVFLLYNFQTVSNRCLVGWGF